MGAPRPLAHTAPRGPLQSPALSCFHQALSSTTSTHWREVCEDAPFFFTHEGRDAWTATRMVYKKFNFFLMALM